MTNWIKYVCISARTFHYFYYPDKKAFPNKKINSQLHYVLGRFRYWLALVAQWWRIHLPMQEAWVLPLGWKDPLEKKILQYSCLGNPMDRRAWWATQSRGLQRVRPDLATKMTICLMAGVINHSQLDSKQNGSVHYSPTFLLC